MRTIYSPYHGRNVVVGARKRPTKAPRRALSFRDYLAPKAPGAIGYPVRVDWSPMAAAALARMYGNDALGDCVIAAGYHEIGAWTGNATGLPFLASDPQIVADYSAIGGYVPGDPSTDNGCEIPVALDHWTTVGFADGTKLLGSLTLNAADVEETKHALFAFETAILGFECPAAWLDPIPRAPGYTWDLAGDPVPQDGHCVVALGYTVEGLIIDTWGMLGTLTWAAYARYCAPGAFGEAHCPLSPDLVAKGRNASPGGINWLDLLNDYQSMGGAVSP